MVAGDGSPPVKPLGEQHSLRDVKRALSCRTTHGATLLDSQHR